MPPHRLHINVGPNLGSIVPPQEDPSVGVLALEANLGIANYLREKHQKNGYPHRFFVVNCAVAGPPLAGGLASFHYYNAAGGSSSLSEARDEAVGRQAWTNRTAFDPSDTYGPGPAAVDFVPVLSLETVLAAVPTNVSIDFLKTDTQGYDLAVIRSASRLQLRRVRMLTTETYLKGAGNAKYKNVKNDLVDWIPYMRTMGFRLTNPPQPHQSNEYDAIWMRED